MRALKEHDSLAPVTVIVPSNYAGLSLRRALAAQTPVANVHFIVAARLAELLGAARLNSRGARPLTPWIRQLAVRAALRENPGVFGAVASHPSTVRELQRVFDELREVGDEPRSVLAQQGPRTADVVRLYARFREFAVGFFDDIDLTDAGAEAFAGSSSAADEVGRLLVFLPRNISPSFERLLRAASARAGFDAFLGLTGDAAADAEALSTARRLDPGGSPEARTEMPSVSLVISATDPEEEVREVLRQAMARTRAGTPLHRMGVAYGSSEIYAGLLHDAMTSAGVPHNGPPSWTLGQTIAGRTLLGLPRIAASSGRGDPGYAREVVLDWLTSAPIWHQGREAPSHRWDEISRQAGVVRGPEQWASRLELHAIGFDAKAVERGDDDGYYQRMAAFTRGLGGFVAELRTNLGGDELLTAPAHAVHALEWLQTYLPEHALQNEDQVEARDRVRRQLEEIAALAGELPVELDESVTRGVFAASLQEALAVPFGRTGSLGSGLFCGPIQTVAEMEFETVFVLGMVEGLLPSPPRDDPLVTAKERGAAGAELAPRDNVAGQRRAFLGSVRAGGEAVLSTPRGDLRSQRAAQPSRWLLEAASNLQGSPVYASGLGEMLVSPPPWLRVVHSFEAALRAIGERASVQEWDLSSLLRHGRIDRHFLVRSEANSNLARGIAARRSRSVRAPVLDGWLGKVAAGRAPVPGANVPISPTALETFAKCPFRYFLGNVLHVGEVERPEEVVTIEPATIGLIVHEILQGFFEATAARPDPFADWTDDERTTLRDLTLGTFGAFEERGQTGKRLTWKAEQARIQRDLQLLLDQELRQRKLTGYRFRQAEVAFGVRPTAARPAPLPAARLKLSDGSEVSFRGVVDRVDEGPNGELAVIDYKTGSTRSYKELKPANPMAGGKFLQLPVYALAFKDQTPSAVTARYWFISEQAGFDERAVVLDAAANRAFEGIVNTLVSTMRGGYFPAVPGPEDWAGHATHENCKYCPYDQLCPTAQRTEMWEAARRDPGLTAFARLETAEEAGTDDDD